MSVSFEKLFVGFQVLAGALCAEPDPGHPGLSYVDSLFFDVSGERASDRLRRQTRAKEMCGRCPRLADGSCAAYAQTAHIAGVVAGMTEEERRDRRMLRVEGGGVVPHVSDPWGLGG